MPRRSKHLRDTLADPQFIALPADPHPLVAAWMEEDRKAEEAARKENREHSGKHEDTYMGRRKLRICDALFKAAEEKGYRLDHPQHYLALASLTIKERRIEWSLQEPTSRSRIPLSKKELKRPDNIARGITTREVWTPTGKFKIVARTGHSMKTQISERMDRPFERRIGEVLGRFEKLVDADIAREIRWAEMDKEIEEDIKARERPRRLSAMEEARWNRLRKLTENWHEAESLRSFIDAVEQALGKGARTGRPMAWLEWARWRADWLDPLSDGSVSARRITSWRYTPRPREYELSDWELA
jgi:hypothetical protein